MFLHDRFYIIVECDAIPQPWEMCWQWIARCTNKACWGIWKEIGRVNRVRGYGGMGGSDGERENGEEEKKADIMEWAVGGDTNRAVTDRNWHHRFSKWDGVHQAHRDSVHREGWQKKERKRFVAWRVKGMKWIRARSPSGVYPGDMCGWVRERSGSGSRDGCGAGPQKPPKVWRRERQGPLSWKKQDNKQESTLIYKLPTLMSGSNTHNYSFIVSEICS